MVAVRDLKGLDNGRNYWFKNLDTSILEPTNQSLIKVFEPINDIMWYQMFWYQFNLKSMSPPLLGW